MIGPRIVPPRLGADDPTQVGLAHLVAAARRAAPELDAVLAQAGHDPLAQPRVGPPQYQRESVVTAALGRKIGLIGGRVEVVEEKAQILRPAGDAGVEALQLRAA